MFILQLEYFERENFFKFDSYAIIIPINNGMDPFKMVYHNKSDDLFT